MSATEVQQTQMKALHQIRYLPEAEWKAGPIICKAKIDRYNERGEWFYHACPVPNCLKNMKATADETRRECRLHPAQTSRPIPWYRIGLVLHDGKVELKATIFGKAAEQLYNIPCIDLWHQMKGSKEFLPQILAAAKQWKIFQIRKGTSKLDSTQRDFLIHAVFPLEGNHSAELLSTPPPLQLTTPPLQKESQSSTSTPTVPKKVASVKKKVSLSMKNHPPKKQEVLFCCFVLLIFCLCNSHLLEKKCRR